MSQCGLIGISLMVSQVEHLFTDLLAICISSLEKCPLETFSHFPAGCLLFYQVLSVSHVLDVNPVSDMWLANILSHFIRCLFILLFPLLCRIFLLCCSPTCSFLLLLIMLLVSYQKKIITKSNVKELLPWEFDGFKPYI